MPKSRSLALYQVRRRWTASEARAALAALEASRLSAHAFAKREGLDVQRLYWWQRRIGAKTATPAFVEIERRPGEPVEIVLRSGRVLRVAETIDVAVLRRLVEALEDDRAC
jgi:hypothetical protein